jgi:hypothetical protein
MYTKFHIYNNLLGTKCLSDSFVFKDERMIKQHQSVYTDSIYQYYYALWTVKNKMNVNDHGR